MELLNDKEMRLINYAVPGVVVRVDDQIFVVRAVGRTKKFYGVTMIEAENRETNERWMFDPILVRGNYLGRVRGGEFVKENIEIQRVS